MGRYTLTLSSLCISTQILSLLSAHVYLELNLKLSIYFSSDFYTYFKTVLTHYVPLSTFEDSPCGTI